MKSNVTVTYQIDDPAVAAQELTEGIGGSFQLCANSVGILLCYSDADQGALLRRLKEMVPFPVVGCTTIACMDQKDGFHAMAATLTVLTADDCAFSTARSGPIDSGNVQEQIRETYARCTSEGDPPGLVLAFAPYRLEIMLDMYSDTLREVAPGIPVIGGLPSYNASGDENLVFYGDAAYPDRLALVAITGNIRPVFTVKTVSCNPINRKRKVTSSKGNVIYTVGGEPFTDFLREVGMPVDMLADGNNTVGFVANPLMVETKTGFRFFRTLHDINLEEGSGTAIGQVPPDALISVCPMHRDDIVSAAEQGIRNLREQMDRASGDGYVFSTVIAVSCIGRHLLMSPHSSAEVEQLLGGFPAGLTLSGFYGYGELGPLSGDAEKLRLFAHNESLVLCAF